MNFNSIDFAIFLPIVFMIHWLVTIKSLNSQNFVIVVASYLFYGWWDWRFLSLIFLSTIIDYLLGLELSKQKIKLTRKILLWISILANLGFLGFFKYYNFFADNLTYAFSFFGAEINVNTLSIILPVGISFYTFQTMSYTIDVYKRKIEPTKNFLSFMAFVSFFPQLVAGPIERAGQLLPQFNRRRIFDYSKSVDGMRQILWGLFKKVIIADNCAEYANIIFDNSTGYPGSTLVLGALFFTFQIYGDFSGYSDIAIGTARLFGINLMRNFNFPYFSRNFSEFWRRWHISLSTWFRDYLYIPLGGGNGGTLKRVRNTIIIFLVSGFWHGANWTFIVWGALNAIYLLPTLSITNNRNRMEETKQGKLLPSVKELLQIVLTFSLTVFSWIFFRAISIEHALNYISVIFSESLFEIPKLPNTKNAILVLLLIVIFVVVEWAGRESQYAIEKLGLSWRRIFRWGLYFTIITMIFLFTSKDQQFIYFQF